MKAKEFGFIIGLIMVNSLQAVHVTNATIWPIKFTAYFQWANPQVIELAPGETGGYNEGFIKTGYKVEIKQGSGNGWEEFYDKPTTAGGNRHVLVYFKYRLNDKKEIVTDPAGNAQGDVEVFDKLV